MIKRGSSFYIIIHKTGGCPEDCGYFRQAARYHTEIEAMI
jgi:biotin synthase-like enzyme